MLGQKDTMLDTVIDEIPGVVHKNPVDSVPTVFSNLLQRLFSGRPTLKKKRIEQPNHLNFNQLVDK